MNGLSLGGAGGYTVARELLRHMAIDRPNWQFSMVLISNDPLHEEMRHENLPANTNLIWAPAATSRFMPRWKYESRVLPVWAKEHGISGVVQLNGMIVKQLKLPTLCLNQNPWPYRPEAWGSLKDRVSAWAKRRAMASAMRRADVYGWTSKYIRDLVCGWHGFSPVRSEVFYNGLPDEWIKRAERSTPLDARPLEIATVSNVSPYKRQDVVIKALAKLVKRPGLETLTYRIVGKIDPESYRDELVALANSEGVGDRVIIEGRVSESRVREVMSSARCFVMMSVCESFGIPVIEAMSHGTPVVAADCCALPEVCGGAADLCPMDDVAGLKSRLERVLLDPEHAQALRRAGSERVRQFSWSITGGKMAQSLDSITGDRR